MAGWQMSESSVEREQQGKKYTIKGRISMPLTEPNFKYIMSTSNPGSLGEKKVPVATFLQISCNTSEVNCLMSGA